MTEDEKLLVQEGADEIRRLRDENDSLRLQNTQWQTMATLTFAVQCRGKYAGPAWHSIAAFDKRGPAEWYLKQQRRDLPWEYRIAELTDRSSSELIAQQDKHEPDQG